MDVFFVVRFEGVFNIIKMAEIYNASGKTKTGEEIRVTKPISAIVISSDRKLSELTNETITIYVERADNNETILQKISLLAFVLASAHGEAAIDSSDGFKVLCELANNGSIELAENESLRISMEGLASASTYSIETIESPVARTEAIEYDKKVMLDGETVREYDIEDADLVVFDNADVIEEIDLSYDNGVTTKHTLSELRALQHDIDPFIAIGVGDDSETVIPSSLPDNLIISLVGVDSIEIRKASSGVVDMTFQNVYALE